MNTPDAVCCTVHRPYDEASAQDLAAKVLAEKLAACVTLLPGATSLYYWESSWNKSTKSRCCSKPT